MSETRAVYEVLQTPRKPDTLQPEQRRRLLARSLDELEAEAILLERTLIQMLNEVRRLQGKRSVIVPKG